MSFAFFVQQATCAPPPEDVEQKVRPELVGLKAGAAILKARALDLKEALFFAVCDGNATTESLEVFCPTSRPTMNRHLRSLIKDSLLSRKKDPTKPCGYLYSATEKGEEIYASLKK